MLLFQMFVMGEKIEFKASLALVYSAFHSGNWKLNKACMYYKMALKNLNLHKTDQLYSHKWDYAQTPLLYKCHHILTDTLPPKLANIKSVVCFALFIVDEYTNIGLL